MYSRNPRGWWDLGVTYVQEITFLTSMGITLLQGRIGQCMGDPTWTVPTGWLPSIPGGPAVSTTPEPYRWSLVKYPVWEPWLNFWRITLCSRATVWSSGISQEANLISYSPLIAFDPPQLISIASTCKGSISYSQLLNPFLPAPLSTQ